MAGVVEAVGTHVSGFHPGDEVYGMTGGVGGVQGSLAEYAAVDARLLSKKPTSFSMRDAASLPLAFITAWEGLVDRAQVRLGQSVLVMGAGGVGNAVIQLALAFGARVFAVGGASRSAQIRAWGATPISRETSVEATHTLVSKAALTLVSCPIGCTRRPPLSDVSKHRKRLLPIIDGSVLAYGT